MPIVVTEQCWDIRTVSELQFSHAVAYSPPLPLLGGILTKRLPLSQEIGLKARRWQGRKERYGRPRSGTAYAPGIAGKAGTVTSNSW